MAYIKIFYASEMTETTANRERILSTYLSAPEKSFFPNKVVRFAQISYVLECAITHVRVV